MGLTAHQKRRIQQRARQFAEKWSSKKGLKEDRDSEAFIDGFFGIFGIDRLGNNIVFEYELNSSGRIDVFWPGVILIENKSSGSRLSEAFQQAKKYYQELEDYPRPKYILVNNFNDFEIYTFKRGYGKKQDSWLRERAFSLNELSESKNISLFYYFFDHKHEKIEIDKGTSEQVEVVHHQALASPVPTGLPKAHQSPRETCSEVPKHEKIEIDKFYTENSIDQELVEKLIEKRIKAIMHKTRYGILKLALVSCLSLTLGYLISDGQPRAWLESVVEGSTREAR